MLFIFTKQNHQGVIGFSRFYGYLDVNSNNLDLKVKDSIYAQTLNFSLNSSV